MFLLSLPKSLDIMSPDELYKEFDKPDLEPVVRIDKRPRVPKHIIWLGGGECELISLTEAENFLSDLGGSFVPSTNQR